MQRTVPPCSPKEGGFAFTGTQEALAPMFEFARAIGAPLSWRVDQALPDPFLLLIKTCGANVKPGEALYDAFVRGQFPGVEACVLEPSDPVLWRRSIGPDAADAIGLP